MRTASLASLLVVIALLFGCAMPQWRVFQTRIDPKLADRPAAQVEAERQGASFIRVRSAAPDANPILQLQQIHGVATELSASLGEPKQAVTAADYERTIAELRSGKIADQERIRKWEAFARKYADKPLEDTGINLAGPAGALGLIAVIAACIACPAIGWALLRALPLLWGFFRSTTAAIGEFAQSHPEAGAKLADTLSVKMDRAHKALVRHRAGKVRILATASSS